VKLTEWFTCERSQHLMKACALIGLEGAVMKLHRSICQRATAGLKLDQDLQLFDRVAPASMSPSPPLSSLTNPPCRQTGSTFAASRFM
jgi:hypothetical protein